MLSVPICTGNLRYYLNLNITKHYDVFCHGVKQITASTYTLFTYGIIKVELTSTVTHTPMFCTATEFTYTGTPYTNNYDV